ncbi:MAG TPA: HAD-IA family hydrolase [Thermoplasmata archaeon]|nr:HAD-IA family hydrolase [Thermoplasmata archaeon]
MRTGVVFLDWGGTLVDSLRDPFPVYRSVLTTRGIEIARGPFDEAWARLPPEDAATAHRYLGRTDDYWRGWDGRALRELGISDEDGSIGAALREAFVDPAWHTPYPETVEVLDELRRLGYELHVVSNNTEDLVRVLRNLGWGSRFSSVSFSQEVGAEKPDPRLFRLALRRAAANPPEVVHVGDSWESDVEGAEGVGIRPVWLNRQGLPRRGAVRAIRDLRGLLPVLEARS